jgi:hypothetical protein
VKNLAEKPFIRNMAARLDAMTGSSLTIKMPERGDTWGLFPPSRVSVFLGLTRTLFTFAHVSESPTGKLLRTDFARYRCQYGRMKKKRQPKSPASTKIADVKREMQEPRLAKSVRDDPNYQVVLADEEPTR